MGDGIRSTAAPECAPPEEGVEAGGICWDRLKQRGRRACAINGAPSVPHTAVSRFLDCGRNHARGRRHPVIPAPHPRTNEWESPSGVCPVGTGIPPRRDYAAVQAALRYKQVTHHSRNVFQSAPAVGPRYLCVASTSGTARCGVPRASAHPVYEERYPGHVLAPREQGGVICSPLVRIARKHHPSRVRNNSLTRCND